MHGAQDFQAAREAEDITRMAIYIGFSEPTGNKASASKSLHHYAIPLKINGTPYTVWFNAREPMAESYSIFYEMGLVKKTARKDQSVTGSNPIDSHSELQVNVAEFLDFVKREIPAMASVKPSIPDGANFFECCYEHLK